MAKDGTVHETLQEVCTRGWTCFHCGETFHTIGGAQDHFGNYLGATPGCVLKVQLGNERGWLMEIRKLQEEVQSLRRLMNEEYWSMTAFNAHLETLLGSFKPFRKCRTLQDVFNVYDSMEGRALSAEERIAEAEL